jgi:hypothetical protein
MFLYFPIIILFIIAAFLVQTYKFCTEEKNTKEVPKFFSSCLEKHGLY